MNKRLLFILSCVASSVAWGSGFQVVEQGASNVGTATAGATVNANNDSSAAFWNPSAVSFADFTTKVDGSLSVIIPRFNFDDKGTVVPSANRGGDGGSGGKATPVPNLYVAHKLDEDWALTLSVTAPFGLETKYDDDWVGRYHAVQSTVTAMDFNPSVAYKVCDWFSVSVGASASFVDAKLTNAYTDTIQAKMQGDSWSAGANVGFTIQYMEGGRVGFSYRSQVDHTLDGTLDIGPMRQDIEADVTLPNYYCIGFYQRLWGALEDFAIMADYTYTQWSSFEELNIKSKATGQTVSYTPENWKDTSKVALGIHYYASEDLTLRFGTAWDESPVKNAGYRTPRIPDSDRIWLSCGLGYKLGGINIDLAYTFIMFNDVTINNYAHNADGSKRPDPIIGDFGGHAHVIAVQVGVKW